MSLHRPAVQVNDFHPFAALNKRSERHITPNVRNGRMGLIVLTAVGLSVVFNALLRRPLPKTINDEWKEAERKRNAIIMDTPIAKCAHPPALGPSISSLPPGTKLVLR